MVDERALTSLLEASQDLHRDAMHEVVPAIDRLVEHHHDVGAPALDAAQAEWVNADRRQFVGHAAAALAAAGLLAGGVASALLAVTATPAYADKPLDLQILQTATSLELVAVATYEAALERDFIANGNPVLKKFAETTKAQHTDHGRAFAGLTSLLGGKEQTDPNPKYLAVLNDTKPTLKSAADVVTLATTLEVVATETYLRNCTLLDNGDARALFASVMGVEGQHVAVLRAVAALLAAGAGDLIAIPTQVGTLPATVGSVAFPAAFEPVTKASPPEEGAVK